MSNPGKRALVNPVAPIRYRQLDVRTRPVTATVSASSSVLRATQIAWNRNGPPGGPYYTAPITTGQSQKVVTLY